MSERRIELIVNGDRHALTVPVNATLLEVLRDQLGLTGTKRGCTSGACGVCTVQRDDAAAVLSCLSLAVDWDGCSVTTIEGLASPAGLHPLQEAFLELGAVQCGYCTPGLVMTAKALLDRDEGPDDAAINEALAGTLCRCTGHIKVKHAVRAAIQRTLQARDRDGTTG